MSNTPDKDDDPLDLDALDNEITGGNEQEDDFLADLNDILDDNENGDDDLARDLDDLDSIFDEFDENSAGNEAPADEDEALDNLDDLLDLGDEEAGAEAADNEMPAAMEPEANDSGEADDELVSLDLGEDELDLSGDSPAADEGPASEELDLADTAMAEEAAEEATAEAPLAEALAAGAGATAAMAAQSAATPADEPRAAAAPAAPAASGRLAIALAAVGLLVAVAAGFLAWQQGGRVAELEMRLSDSETATPALDPRISPLLNEVETLRERVSELALLIEGPMSHLRESNEQTLVDFDQRLGAIEGQLEKLTKAPAAAAPKAAAKPTPPPAKGWAVNLVSLTNEKTATQEQARLRRDGIDATINRAQVSGQTWYRLQVTGFADYDAAKAYLERIRRETELKNAWVAKLQ